MTSELQLIPEEHSQPPKHPVSDGERYKRIERALTFGIPPITLDDARWLWAQAFDPLPPLPKRCEKCGGGGRLMYGPLSRPHSGPCSACGGSGFEGGAKP